MSSISSLLAMPKTSPVLSSFFYLSISPLFSSSLFSDNTTRITKHKTKLKHPNILKKNKTTQKEERPFMGLSSSRSLNPYLFTLSEISFSSRLPLSVPGLYSQSSIIFPSASNVYLPAGINPFDAFSLNAYSQSLTAFNVLFMK